MCTVLLPLDVTPVAVNKYIISYHIISIKNVQQFVNECQYGYELSIFGETSGCIWRKEVVRQDVRMM
jgi:hypothetical protein